MTASGPEAVLSSPAKPYPKALEHVGTVTVEPTVENGPVCSVSFDGPYTGSVVVLLTPASANAVKAGLYATSTSNDFTVHAVSAEIGQQLTFHYQVIGVAE